MTPNFRVHFVPKDGTSSGARCGLSGSRTSGWFRFPGSEVRISDLEVEVAFFLFFFWL